METNYCLNRDKIHLATKRKLMSRIRFFSENERWSNLRPSLNYKWKEITKYLDDFSQLKMIQAWPTSQMGFFFFEIA